MTKNKYSLPAEWIEQDAIMLTWPHKETDWQPILEKVEPVFVDICIAITKHQKLVIVCHDDSIKHHVTHLLEQANVLVSNNVLFIISPSNDTWARDHGPITLVSSDDIKALDFTFNGWGNKFASSLDNQINQVLFKHQDIKVDSHQVINFVLEGGAIESDGRGHLLTTAKCIFNPNRNPNYTHEQVTKHLLTTLGLDQALVLNHGDLLGDDTDAHIDTLCRFAPNNTILYTKCYREEDEHFPELTLMERELTQFKTKHGEKFNLVPLPLPAAKYNSEGDRLPATYANFLIINNAVLVPTYQDENDRKAIEKIAIAFPDRQIIGIDCLAIIEQFGSLHCLTMQLPKGYLN